MSDPRTPRVLLLTLSRRTSAKGNEYWAGYLGKASVVGFPGEPDKFGNETCVPAHNYETRLCAYAAIGIGPI